jgi:glycerate dehydrogenase
MPAPPRIVFLDAGTVDDLPTFDRFHGLGDFTAYPRSRPEEVTRRARHAEVIITNKVAITADHLADLPDLKLICVAATGTNNIDKEAAEERGIPVRNVAGYSTDSVAQLTLTAYFTVAMDLIHLNREVYDGNYSRAQDFTLWRHPFYELANARYGIIGLGTIGSRVAEIAAAYGAEVVYYSSRGHDHDVPYPRLELDEFLRSCDVISIHCALSEATRGLIGREELRKMKPSAYLVNVARGGIIDEAALVDALNGGAVAGAAVDVFTDEPLPEDHVYLGVNNPEKLLLTPHVGWASVEARTRLIDGIMENIRQGWE